MKINVFLMPDLVVDYITKDLTIKGGHIIDIDSDLIDPKVFVVNVSLSGKNIEVFGFIDATQAESCFKKIAQPKFSNWDEYQVADISAILDDGFESNGDGSLNITWLI